MSQHAHKRNCEPTNIGVNPQGRSQQCTAGVTKMRLVKACRNHKHFLCDKCKQLFNYDMNYSELIENQLAGVI